MRSLLAWVRWYFRVGFTGRKWCEEQAEFWTRQAARWHEFADLWVQMRDQGGPLKCAEEAMWCRTHAKECLDTAASYRPPRKAA